MNWLAVAALIAAAPLDGRGKPMKDDLLDQLAGSWRLDRHHRGPRGAQCRAGARAPVPPHPPRKQPYLAYVYLGHDNLSDRYVVHWIDVSAFG